VRIGKKTDGKVRLTTEFLLMMKIRIILLSLLVIFGSLLVLNALGPPDAEQKAKIGLIISQLEKISKKCGTLEEFGRQTVTLGMNILSIGPSAVYVLSPRINNQDWKVRFWIVDILGYLGNPDAERPLTRVINNETEQEEVREQAAKSLKRLKETPPENIDQ